MAGAGTVWVDVLPDLKKFGQRLQGEVGGLGNSFGQVGRWASTAFGEVIDIAGQAGAAILGIGAAGAAMGTQTNAGLETAELQFRTLLGSADAAKERVAALFEFAKVTPFEAEPIIQASRLLQTFGGDALAAESNLRLVGDAAAATNTPIDELAFWVGRAYSAIQGGQPFGEAAMRLQELAILSPEARARMEELQDTGADASEVWAVLEQELGKFNGAMVLQAESWVGLTSTAQDWIALTAGDVFRPLFESAKNMLGALLDLGESTAVQDLLDEITMLVFDGSAKAEEFVQTVVGKINGADFGGIFDKVRGLGDQINGLEPYLAGAGLAMSAFSLRSIPMIGALVPPWLPVVAAIGGFVLSTDEGREAMRGIGEAAQEAGKILGPAIAESLRELEPSLREFITAVGELAQALLPALATVAGSAGQAFTTVLAAGLQAVSPLLTTFADVVANIPEPMLELIGMFFGARAALGGIVTTIGHVVTAFSGLAAGMGPWGMALVGFGLLVGGLSTLLGGNDQAAREAEQGARQFANAIRDAGDATEGIRQATADLIVDQPELAGQLRQTGLDADDLADALNGTNTEWDAFVDGVLAAAEQAGLSGIEISKMVSSLESMRTSATQAKGDVDDVNASLQGTKTGADDAKKAVDDFKRTLDEMGGAAISAEQANIAYRDSIDRAREAVFTAGEETSIYTEKGRAARDAILDIKGRSDDLIVSMIDQGASFDEVKAKQAETAQTMMDLLLPSFNNNEEAAAQYTAKLLGIPESRITDIHSNADLQREAMELLKGAVEQIPAYKRVDIDVWQNFKIAGQIANPFSAFKPTAEGGIFDKPEVRLFAEAGAEAVLPLTDPDRSWQLIRQSGLLDHLPAGSAGTSLGQVHLHFPGVATADDARQILPVARAEMQRLVRAS